MGGIHFGSLLLGMLVFWLLQKFVLGRKAAAA